MKIVFKNFISLNQIEKKEILELRNKEYIRENMINSEPISLENHLLFIESLKENKNKKYFALFKEDEFLGSMNFIKEDILSWGLYFQNEINPILKTCSTYIFLEYIFENLDEEINSFVKKSNFQALNFNKNFGFTKTDEDEEFIYLKLTKEDWINQKSSKLLKPIKRYLDKIEYYFE